jgi:hypothetical protein
MLSLFRVNFNSLSLQINRSDQLDDGKIVEEGSSIELGVNGNARNISLNVGVELDIVVDVPFSKTDTQLLSAVSVLQNLKVN